MNQFISLTKGVNVGGLRLEMADLRSVYKSVGPTNVRTVLQSGRLLLVVT